jgi:hypothetical protein
MQAVFGNEALRRAPNFLPNAARAGIPGNIPPQNGPAEAKAEHKQIPEVWVLRLLVGRAEAKFARRIFGRGQHRANPSKSCL